VKKPTVERLKELLDYDPETGVFTWRVSRGGAVDAGDTAGTKDSRGYLQIGVDRTLYLAHRLAWLYTYGEWPKNALDHINRIRTDNRIANLRPATHALNNQNTSVARNNKSGVTGVWRNTRLNKWQAYIRINGQQIHLGLFDQFDAAVQVRRAAERQYHPFRSEI
jgi:hypothetical protein